MYFIIAFLLFLSPVWNNPLKDKNYELHEVSIHKGDGAFSLLRRYNLSNSACNIDQFYELNSLNKNSFLRHDKKYKLPVYIFTYDGKSIRSTIGINDWDTAVRIKEYNDNLLSIGLRDQTYADSRILWVPHNELFCNELNTSEITSIEKEEIKETEPPTEETVIEKNDKKYEENELYGKAYAKTELIDESLKETVFYVISGHGGIDPGAVCKDCPETLCEDEYAYDVALRLARNLRQHGATVEMVIQDKDGIRDESFLKCDTDERLADGSKLPYSQRVRLRQRAIYVNNKYALYKRQGISKQYVVSIHVDSRSAKHKQDVFFCYYGESDSGKKLAQTLQNKFNQKYDEHQKNRGYHGHIDKRSLYVLMNTAPPAVLVELANIKNKSDHRRILVKENRQALANWLYEGLADHALEKSN